MHNKNIDYWGNNTGFDLSCLGMSYLYLDNLFHIKEMTVHFKEVGLCTASLWTGICKCCCCRDLKTEPAF